tara:strand:+ start:1252 stop:1524 length:273 start_codon:yes stop_codon:yes gene_type:complete
MKRLLLLAITAGLLSPIAVKAETIYLVLGTYKQHTVKKEPRLDTQTGSPSIQIIPMESLAQCNAAGEDLMENLYKPIKFFAGGYRCIKGK